jgi:hypothetical protein
MPNIIFFTYFIMAASLPKSFNLSEPIPSLPDGAMSQLISVRPISGGTFNQQAVIECDLGNRGWLDPKSLSIRYKVTLTTDVSGSAMIGTPLYTPFNRVSTLVGAASIDTISQYNQVAQVLVNGTYDIAGKYGLQSGFGYTQLPAGATTTGNMAYVDGRFDASGVGVAYSVAGPLIGTLLANSEKMLPLFAMPQVRLQFTLESLSNIFFISTGATGTSLPSAFAISNFELVYTMCDLGAGVEKMVYDMGRQISIKSHGSSNSAVNVAAGTTGSQSYVFNQRFASIRSAFICPNRADGNGSKWGEICDLTQVANGSTGGDYQLQIGNQAYPQMPLNTNLNESGVLQETRRAFGNLYDNNNSMSINSVEFNKSINDVSNTLLYYEPGKFIVGINLEKCQNTDHVVMSGASTYNTPISCVINIPQATGFAANLNLILDYDAILVLDPVARQLSVRS